ncbi:MAG: tetratricopeptide repeat protein [Janthinobacterium lividum]
MVCPYCSFKNSPTALICGQCGIVLKLGKTSKLIPPVGGGGLSFMRGILPGNRLKHRHAVLQTQIDEAGTQIQERAEADLKDAARAPAARLRLGALFLLQNEIEKSIHWFQQARQMGSADVEFFNNVGATLARRGAQAQAAEMFSRAAQLGPSCVAPAANQAHLFAESGADPDPEGALAAIAELQRALKLEPKNPTLYNRLALILCREHRYEEAVPQFRQALALVPENASIQADAHNNIGLALILCGDDVGNEFEAALQSDSGHAPALVNQTLVRMQKNVTGPEIERLARAVHLDPTSAAVRADYGYGLCRLGAINDGILALKEGIDLNSRLWEACYNLGKAYADQDALDSADRYVARALQFRKCSPEVMTALGVIKTKQKIIPLAIQYFQAVVKLWPQSALAHMNLGIAQGLADEFAEAGLHLKKALELSPKDAQIPAQIGWLHLRRESITAGVEELGVALKLDEHIPEVHNNYGICYIAMGKPELSFTHFARALELRPDFYAVHYQWGYAHAILKNQGAAMREWDLSVRHQPNNADCHSNRGVVFYQKGQIEEAIAEFRHVIVLRLSRMEDFSNLGLAYAKAGKTLHDAARASKKINDPRMKQALERHKQAIDMFDRALVLDPRNVMLHSNRGLACFFASMPEEAMKEWGQVSKIDPAYANRRGKRIQSEYDDSQIALVPFSVPDCAVPIPPKTAAYLPHYLPGYDTEEWDLILTDPALTRLSELRRELRRLDRSLAAQGGK